MSRQSAGVTLQVIATKVCATCGEPVTQRINVLRGVGPSALGVHKTQCPRGHEYTPENTLRSKLGKRSCRECKLASDRRWAVANRERRSLYNAAYRKRRRVA